MTKLLDKIKRLATDPAATKGERQAAAEALRRNGVALDIELSDGIAETEETAMALNEVTLTPIAMIACHSIYAPSRIRQSQTFTLNHWLKMQELIISVSMSPDGKSNPQKMTCYGGYGSYWIRQ